MGKVTGFLEYERLEEGYMLCADQQKCDGFAAWLLIAARHKANRISVI